MLTPGTILQNRYEIVCLLGQGGMGAVYQARALALGGKAVAVKENIGGDFRQFQQEVVILANLNHPNLPRVLDHFVEANAAQYLVMDFVEGEDLDSLIQQRGALPEAQALVWLRQILEAVVYMHSRGVIHRDIKPANIRITPAGQAMLVDFGIAKVYQLGQSTLSGAKAGTPGFAAPEQYRGGTDQHSDIYSLGATLYALLTGNAPPDAKALETRTATLTLPRVLNPAISMQTEQVILQAMAVQPEARFQNVGAMQRAVQPWSAAGQRTVAGFQDAGAMPRVARSATQGSGWMRWIVALVIVGMIALVGVLGVSILLSGDQPAIPTARVAMATETGAVPVTQVVATVIVSPIPIVAPTSAPVPSVIASTIPTATRTRQLAVTPTRVASVTAVPKPSNPQTEVRLDYKDGLIATTVATGNQSKFPGNNETVTSAVWSPDGTQVLITWAKRGTVRRVGDLYACGKEWAWDPSTGWGYRTKWCRYAPDYFPSEYGGSVRLLSRNGQTISDLATGSPEPQFVGDPQIAYSDAIWAPDGKRLAVSYKQADGNRCPFVGYADLSGLRKLKDCEADDHPRFWSVDGKWMITWSDRGLKFYAYEVDGGRRLALSELGGIKIYDQRYYPWRTVDHATCKDSNFWACE